MRRIAFTILGGLAAGLYAQSPQGSQVIGPFGGLHDSDSSITIKENEAQAASNVLLTKDGAGLKSREGIAVDATLTVTSSPVTGTHYFKTTGGSLIRLVMHDIYVSKSADGGSFENIVTTAPTGIRLWDCADNYGIAYCLSSNNIRPFSYNGSAVTWYPTEIPQGTQIEMTPSRLIVTGTAANPNRINYSQAGALTTFTAGTTASSAFTDDIGITGDKITAIKYALGRLIFWTNNSMGACQGTSQFDTICYDVSKNVGTIEPASVVYYNGMVFFRGTNNHFYAYDGQTLSPMTLPQAVLVGSFQSFLSSAAVQATFGAAFDDGIYWSVAVNSGLTQNRVIYYDGLRGALFPWSLNVSALLPTETTLYMGCSDCGKLYKYGGGVVTDTGTAITASWTSKDFSLGDITTEKSIERISLIMKNQTSGNLSLDYVINGTSTTTKTVSMIGTSGNPLTLRNFNTPLGIKGNLFHAKVYGSAPWEIYGIKFDYQPLPWRTQ